MNLEEALVAIWRQTLKENANLVELGGRSYPVHRTQRKRLRQVDFAFEGQTLRGIEQNPETNSRWAQMARQGARVMQFTLVQAGSGGLRGGRYLANVADGKLTFYRPSAAPTGKATTRSAKAGG